MFFFSLQPSVRTAEWTLLYTLIHHVELFLPLFEWHSTICLFVHNTVVFLSAINVLFPVRWLWISANILRIFQRISEQNINVASTHRMLKCNFITIRDYWVSDEWGPYFKLSNSYHLYHKVNHTKCSKGARQ